MIKKLLLILFVTFCSIGFAQSSISNLESTPNPFSESTIIKFNSTANQSAFFTVKNILGKTVYRGYIAAKKGNNSYPFKRGDLVAGIYIYAVQTANNDFISKRFVIK